MDTNRFARLARRTTAGLRALPDFIVIGAQRSGTSSLFSYLTQHPGIAGSVTKEVHYFDLHFDRGVSWYRSNFPLSSANGGAITGEATPYYLYHPAVPQRVYALLPDAKLIAILRNPTERALSQYFHAVKNRGETLPLMEALFAEESRIAAELARYGAAASFGGAAQQIHSYKQRGLYKMQLDRYWSLFDAAQILVLDSADLFTRPQETLREIFGFLGVTPGFEPRDLAPKNRNPAKQAVQPEVYAYLDAYFAPHNRELYEALGRDLGWETPRHKEELP